MDPTPIVVFVCEHGAAKSILAAAYFNKLASEKYLDMRAIARGTNPDAELSPDTITGLNADGLSPTETAPRKMSLAEIRSARRVVTFCELPIDYRMDIPVDQWEGIPPVSENYVAARDAILSRLMTFIAGMKSGQ